MKEILGCIRRADQDFGMIEDGDRVAVGVSGGKDSLLLLYALSLYRRFSPHPFTLQAVTLTMGLEPFDLSGVQALCDRLEVPYVVRETQIGRIVFEERREKNPCALCAKMRRGALNDLCRELGVTKLALGHHRDDALETLLMSLLYEGRLHTFQPVTRFDRTPVVQIRPLIYAPEKVIVHYARRLDLPVVASPCPANGRTKREDMKDLLDLICRRVPNARELMLSALRNTEQYGLWPAARRADEPRNS
ncbi:MAG: tRNA 2-thiocytidine biosynthesis TtcA family protein [Eubacteriales bacterium]|nr:tRNA 2-thiocytidine biosynthesis TtcA family protein [Eubacteriales bacterium]